MKTNKGFSLLEVIIASAIAVTLLISMLGFFFQVYSFWQKNTLNSNYLEEIIFAFDNIKEKTWAGKILNSSNTDTLDIQDLDEKNVSFYLKNKKVCMYKNKTSYLTTGKFPLQKLKFYYSEKYKLDHVYFEIDLKKNFTFYL